MNPCSTVVVSPRSVEGYSQHRLPFFLQFLVRSLSCKLLAGNFVDQVKYWLYFFFLTEQKLHQLILKELKIQNLPALILAFFFFF